MTIDILLIAVGWALVTTASAIHLRRFRRNQFGPFAHRQQRISAPRRSWQVNALFMVGIIVAVWGGTDAQRHHLDSWAALAFVFVPMLLALAVMTTVHNRRVKAESM